MPRDAFNQRASALEDEFFHRVDQQLILKLKEQHELEEDEIALTVATGIEDKEILKELTDVQINPKTLMAFSLYPSIHVAWASGRVGKAEREAVLKGAVNAGVVQGSPAHFLLQSWLERKPSAELFKAWKAFIHATRPVMSDVAFRELHAAAARRALEIAEAAGGFLGFHKVSKAEEKALAELDAIFNDAGSVAS